MVSDAQRQAYGAQIHLNNEIAVTMGAIAKEAAAKASTEAVLAVMDRIRDLIDPDERFVWATIAPGGDYDVDVPLDGRWQLDGAVLLSTTATVWPVSVGIRGLYSQEEVWLTQASPKFDAHITVEGSEKLRIHNYDGTATARVIVTYKRTWQELRPGGVGER
jgi:hypothetical protein